MALIPIFPGLVNPEGRLILRDRDRPKRQEWLRALAGNAVEVVIRLQPRQRTLDQSAYLHAVPFRLIHEETGHSVDEVKRLCLAAKFGTRALDERGWPIPMIEHTSSLDVAQGSDLIEFIPPYAMHEFNGLEIPLPGEVEFR